MPDGMTSQTEHTHRNLQRTAGHRSIVFFFHEKYTFRETIFTNVKINFALFHDDFTVNFEITKKKTTVLDLKINLKIAKKCQKFSASLRSAEYNHFSFCLVVR